ncbi:MAG: dTMP kinase [Planctomycetaceae bacterium]
MFITLDGIDGAGKSSQVALLCDHLESQGERVLRVRDPGGTPAGEAIRSLLLDSDLTMDRRCEALLFLAARSQLVESQIRPALQAGTIVVSDRFLLANVVYQSIGSDLQPDDLWRVGEWASGGLRPDLTLLLDMPAEAAMARLDRPKDRMESRGKDYLEAVRLAFLVQLPRAAHSTAIIQADRPLEEIHQEILSAVREAKQ